MLPQLLDAPEHTGTEVTLNTMECLNTTFGFHSRTSGPQHILDDKLLIQK